ncbi:hypothetical protein HMPREF1983_01353 [Gemella bergeri ATCC 700627]|uniref:Uncharacterized protein n=1 Tax=Gemella bergeri ATCC 700627 TaxID=1321820 RepID=U2S0U1_9BACL|nr:hypothetical protein HMPREF1983_01353 [Gemella bergeri ATCC 700627]
MLQALSTTAKIKVKKTVILRLMFFVIFFLLVRCMLLCILAYNKHVSKESIAFQE